jgi:hypothetical protein
MSCVDVPTAYVDARLQGALDAAVHWVAEDLACDGMNRPDRRGLRVTFKGSVGEEHLTLLFGIPALAEGASARHVPVNVTLIREGVGFYGTQGDDKCTLDEVSQTSLPTPEGERPPHRWQIEAHGFCMEPIRALGAGQDAILITRFDFRGQLLWEPEPLPSGPPLVIG